MATAPKRGGYNDTDALRRAVRYSRAMIELGRRLAIDCPPAMLPLVGKLGYYLAGQRDALAEMEQIRSKTKRRTEKDE